MRSLPGAERPPASSLSSKRSSITAADSDSGQLLHVSRPVQPVTYRFGSSSTKHYVIAGTGEVDATDLHEKFRRRWEIEEAFMELTRYWNIDDLGSCRHEVYLAQVYFALLAYALLRVFSDRHGDDPPDIALTPGRELVVYRRDRYAILLPSELFEVVFAHFDRWRENKKRLLEAMRYCEGRPPPQ
jgi:hypothetical protein